LPEKGADNIGYIINNSVAGCRILLKCDKTFDHLTADTLQTFKVKGS